MSCRSCNFPTVHQILDLGSVPLAGAFSSKPDFRTYPLAIEQCQRCSLLQVEQTVPNGLLFNPEYRYATSSVPALVTHFNALAEKIIQGAGVSPFRTRLDVLEIGCNDGTFLELLERQARNYGLTTLSTLGVDASQNMVDIAQNKGLSVVQMNFGLEAAKQKLAPRQYDVVVAANVFAHIEDPMDFLEGVKHCIKKGGYLVIEVHDSELLRKNGQYDFFYHEHVLYWNARSLQDALNRAGFVVLDTQQISTHGGSIRIRAGYGSGMVNGDVTRFIETAPKISWDDFRVAAARNVDILAGVMAKLSHVRLYGAAGRTVTLVHHAGIAHRFDGIYDGSLLRIGRFFPGTEHLIQSEDDLWKVSTRHDTIFLGAWHLEADLVKKIQAAGHKSKAILTPLPYVTLK